MEVSGNLIKKIGTVPAKKYNTRIVNTIQHFKPTKTLNQFG